MSIKQILNNITKELGVKVGDEVMVLRDGSGHFSPEWNRAKAHKITDIDINGYVTFDNGVAKIFKPQMKKITKERKAKIIYLKEIHMYTILVYDNNLGEWIICGTMDAIGNQTMVVFSDDIEAQIFIEDRDSLILVDDDE